MPVPHFHGFQLPFCGEQFTGAEIEAVFINAPHEAYAKGKEPGPKEIPEAITHSLFQRKDTACLRS